MAASSAHLDQGVSYLRCLPGLRMLVAFGLSACVDARPPIGGHLLGIQGGLGRIRLTGEAALRDRYGCGSLTGRACARRSLWLPETPGRPLASPRPTPRMSWSAAPISGLDGANLQRKSWRDAAPASRGHGSAAVPAKTVCRRCGGVLAAVGTSNRAPRNRGARSHRQVTMWPRSRASIA
jgi:hypothetical protein